MPSRLIYGGFIIEDMFEHSIFLIEEHSLDKRDFSLQFISQKEIMIQHYKTTPCNEFHYKNLKTVGKQRFLYCLKRIDSIPWVLVSSSNLGFKDNEDGGSLYFAVFHEISSSTIPLNRPFRANRKGRTDTGFLFVI